ncbi:MAG: hypothetical protein AAFZ87_01345 [Planctomycetota bacterium]
MREDIARIGLTALVAAVLASAGTAALLVRPDHAPDRIEVVPGRARLDDATRIALGEIRDAVENVEQALLALDLGSSAPLREPLLRQQTGVRKHTALESRPTASLPRSRFPWIGPRRSSVDAIVPINEVRLRQLRDEYVAWFDLGDERRMEEIPYRRFKLLPVDTLVEEFGTPTDCGPTDDGFLCTWRAGDLKIEARFVDGYCVAIYD